MAWSEVYIPPTTVVVRSRGHMCHTHYRMLVKLICCLGRSCPTCRVSFPACHATSMWCVCMTAWEWDQYTSYSACGGLLKSRDWLSGLQCCCSSTVVMVEIWGEACYFNNGGMGRQLQASWTESEAVMLHLLAGWLKATARLRLVFGYLSQDFCLFTV